MDREKTRLQLKELTMEELRDAKSRSEGVIAQTWAKVERLKDGNARPKISQAVREKRLAECQRVFNEQGEKLDIIESVRNWLACTMCGRRGLLDPGCVFCSEYR